MAKLHTFLLASIFIAILAGASSAKGSSIGNISKNLGNVGMNGQPNLSFDLLEHPDTAEIQRLGFAFKLTHQVASAYGRKAKTDWQISALKTAVYLDELGNLAWLHPAGRTVRFSKADSGFGRANDGSTAKVFPDVNEVEISTTRGAKWFFKGGFLESVQTRQNAYYIKTDRETILVIGKKDATTPLLEIRYSDTGQLSEFVFADGKRCLFQWTPENCLLRVFGNAGPELVFEYDNMLLKKWRLSDGALHEFKWIPIKITRRLAFGRPPVMLGEDSLYRYRWNHKESVDILEVSRKSGAFVSRTYFSLAGIIQQTPHEILHHSYKR